MVTLPKDLEARIVTKLKRDRLMPRELAEDLQVKKDTIDKVLKHLIDTGVEFDTSKGNRGQIRYHISALPDSGNVFDFGGHDGKYHEWTFAYMGDTHVASTFQLPKSTHAALQVLVDRGVKTVFHSGDVVDGRGIYKGHDENLVTSSIEKQTDMAAELFGRYDRKLRFLSIAGNHDYSFTQQNGAKPLALIDAKIPNFQNLGDFRADVQMNDLTIRLLHGATGRAYAISYPSQTYLRDYFKGLEREEMVGSKGRASVIPHFMFLGHFHTKYHSKDHGIEVFQPGSFQDGDNEYCIRRGLTGPAGLWLLNVKHTGPVIHELGATYISPSIASKEKGAAFAATTRRYRR